MAGERTEKASPQKRKKAVDQGDRLVSRELNTAAAMLAGVLSLHALCSIWTRAWKAGFHSSMALVSTANSAHMTTAEIADRCRSIVLHTLSPLLLFAATTVAGALVIGVMQGGGQISFTALSPKWSRLNPINNAKHLLGAQALVRLSKSMIPAAILGTMVLHKISHQQMYPTSNFRQCMRLFENVYSLLLSTAVAMAIWSAIDFLNNWRARESRLKMTKQDVRDEMKESEGSPQIKRRIRQIQRQMRKRQMRADVKKATVVLTNPTHYAVALMFDFVAMDPPKVLAKGRNLVAMQIREEAQWAGVPIIENPPLARSLYRSVDAGQSIPMELYAAVAGILAFLYRKEMEDRMREREADVAREAKRAARNNRGTSGGDYPNTRDAAPTQTS